MGEDAYGVQRLREDPVVTAMLEQICDISTMGFAAVARVTGRLGGRRRER